MLLIAGTAAQTGKSVLVAALAAYWRTYIPNQPLTVFAPEMSIAGTGSGGTKGGWLDLALVWQQLTALEAETVLLELPGGLGTPLTPEITVADLAWDWRIPVVLVVPVTAEMVGQAIAHVALARQARVHLKGIVLIHCSPETDGALAADADAAHGDAAALIQSFTQVPVLGVLPHLSDPSEGQALAEAASRLELERLFPLSMLVSAS